LAGPSDTLGSPWPPITLRPCLELFSPNSQDLSPASPLWDKKSSFWNKFKLLKYILKKSNS
jgi:hypothetical protein